MTDMRWGGVTCAAIVLACVATPTANAYVPYRTTQGAAFHWAQTRVSLRAFLDGLPGLTAEEATNAVSNAAAAWDAAGNACSFLSLQVEHSAGRGPIEALDCVNSITYQTGDWCHRSTDDTCPLHVYPPEARAVTSVYVSRATGQILEADIELNAFDFSWADLALHPSMTAQDLQDVLTHEFGHLIGLDSTCREPAAPPTATLDDQGQPVPACDVAPQAVRDTTMFDVFSPGETNKRTLEDDDRNGLCATYPRDAGPAAVDGGADGGRCTPPSDGAVGDDALPDLVARDADDTGAAGHRGGEAADAHGDDAGDAGQLPPDGGAPGGASSPGGCACGLAQATPGAGPAWLLAALAVNARRRRSARRAAAPARSRPRS
jgi:hypothetical protein